MEKKLYLTIEEVAARFGVNVSTVYRIAQKGELPGFKIGNQWRFDPKALEEWTKSQQTDHLRESKD